MSCDTCCCGGECTFFMPDPSVSEIAFLFVNSLTIIWSWQIERTVRHGKMFPSNPSYLNS